jgi:hypothetical protein
MSKITSRLDGCLALLWAFGPKGSAIKGLVEEK